MVTLLEMRRRQVDRLQKQVQALEKENDHFRDVLTYFATRGYMPARRALGWKEQSDGRRSS